MNHEDQLRRSADKFSSAGNKPVDDLTKMLDKNVAYIQHNLDHLPAYDHTLPNKTVALALVKISRQLDALLNLHKTQNTN